MHLHFCLTGDLSLGFIWHSWHPDIDLGYPTGANQPSSVPLRSLIQRMCIAHAQQYALYHPVPFIQASGKLMPMARIVFPFPLEGHCSVLKLTPGGVATT